MKNFRIQKYTFILLPYFIISFVMFYFVAWPSILNPGNLRLWADSVTYVQFAEYYNDFGNLVSIGSNFLGPYMLLKATDFNHLFIFFFNIFLLTFSIYIVRKNYKIDSLKFSFLLILNPLTFTSLLLINKEIFGLASLATFLVYIKNSNLIFLFITLCLAAVTRWHEVVVIIVFLIFRLQNRYFQARNTSLFFFLIVVLTLVFPLFSNTFSFINETSADLLSSQSTQSFGLLPILNILQNNFAYFAAFPIKVVANLYGNLAQIANYFTGDSEIWNDIYSISILGHQYWMVLVTLLVIKKNRFHFIWKSDIGLFILVYIAIYSMNLFIQYRYFYPLIIIISLIIASEKPTELSTTQSKFRYNKGKLQE